MTSTSPTPASPAPSVHIRAIITWLAIFPLVLLGMTVMTPFAATWPLPLRALALTAVVVPTAVYLVVPRLLAAHHRLTQRQSTRVAPRDKDSATRHER